MFVVKSYGFILQNVQLIRIYLVSKFNLIKMAQVNLNINEVKDFLRHIVSNNQVIQAQGKNPVAVEVVGDSGIGKTSTIIQVAEELGLNFVKLNLAQIEELGDLVGFPIVQYQIQEKMTTSNPNEVRTPRTAWVNEVSFQEYLKAGFKDTGKTRMSYAAPEWIAGKEDGGILLLDDWNRADTRFIQAVMELVDRQTYISWKLPKNWHIILTSNPDNGDYMVNSIDSAQRTRFITANLKFDVDVWAKWAEEDGVDGRCINFLLMHPELVTQETNARSITTFFNSISSIENFEDQLPLIQMIGEGSVGAEFATMFTMFINNRLDKIITPEKVMSMDDWSSVKGQLTGVIGKEDNYRADIASVITRRLINYNLISAEKSAINQKVLDRLSNLMTEDLFTNDLKYTLVREIVNGNRTKFQKLLMNPEIVKMTIS